MHSSDLLRELRGWEEMTEMMQYMAFCHDTNFEFALLHFEPKIHVT